MYVELTAIGMRIAQKHKLGAGEFICYCPSCWWEAPEKNAAYGCICPGCSSGLRVVQEK
jgi:hypothetical protein